MSNSVNALLNKKGTLSEFLFVKNSALLIKHAS